MFRLANMEPDGREGWLRFDSFEQLVELLEGVGLKTVEIGIHFKAGEGVLKSLFPNCVIDRSRIIKASRLANQSK